MNVNIGLIPKLFYQSWCSKSNPLSKIPDIILNKTISSIPTDCEYKCYTLIEIRKYLSEKWGHEYVELFDKYKKTPHKIDLWRYCILYDTGGTYMDADCVLNSNINFLYNCNCNMVFVTNNRSIKNTFNGFIMVEKGNIIMKEMISYMLRVGTSIENDYYYNCKELYKVVNKYININNETYNYESSIGNVCLLIDKQQSDGRYSAFYKNKNVLVETNRLYPYK
jgi:mannosyltransferase OCH1-like enzyme